MDFFDASSGAQLTSNNHDLVFASQVFEHVSDPVDVLRSAIKTLSHDGVLFVDVPIEYEISLSEGILHQRKHGGALFHMHEHINHYSLKSLRQLVGSAGLVPFFEILPKTHRTALVLAAKPDSKYAKIFENKIERKLLYLSEKNRLLNYQLLAR